jgi:glycogen debranching enzyme
VEFREEAARLAKWCSRHLWDSQTRFFHDRMRDGSLARHLKSIGAYWALLAGGVGPRRLRGFRAHLSDEGAFNRPHRVPSLSADSTGYREDGGYWCGAVWSPTTAMIVRGLELAGHPDPAHAIALNHLDNVVDCHAETGTFFECYAPEKHAAGIHRRDFVGWTGLAPTSLLMEHVFGLRPNAVANRLVWNIRLTDGHGVQKYPFGADGEMDLYCPPRRSMDETPRPMIRSTRPVEIEIRWRSGRLKMTAGD